MEKKVVHRLNVLGEKAHVAFPRLMYFVKGPFFNVDNMIKVPGVSFETPGLSRPFVALRT
jgi:hypothetical protein